MRVAEGQEHIRISDGYINLFQGEYTELTARLGQGYGVLRDCFDMLHTAALVVGGGVGTIPQQV